jgi:hypothetical protein
MSNNDGKQSAAAAATAIDGKQSAAAAAAASTNGKPAAAVTICYLSSAGAEPAEPIDGKCAVCALTKPAKILKVIHTDQATMLYVCADHQKPMAAAWSETVAATMNADAAAGKPKPLANKKPVRKPMSTTAPTEPSAGDTIAAWTYFNDKRTVGGDEPTAIEICYLSSSVTDDDKKSLPDDQTNADGCRTCALTQQRAVTAHANGYTTTIYFCWQHEKQLAKRDDGTFEPIRGLAR